MLSIWGTKTLDRARRRLVTPIRPAPEAADAPVAPVEPEPDVRDTIVLAFGRDEKARFSAALAETLGPDTPRLDTPARLADALGASLRRVGGAGRPIVTRSPAGLYTPEYWRIRVDGADRRARAELERLAGRRFDS